MAAFGCKHGLVFLVSVAGGGRVLFKLRGHDEDVYSLAWCPQPRQGETEREFHFVTSSRDRSLRVWSSGQGRQVQCLKLQEPEGGGKGGGAGAQPSSLWPGLAPALC